MYLMYNTILKEKEIPMKTQITYEMDSTLNEEAELEKAVQFMIKEYEENKELTYLTALDSKDFE